MLIIHALDFIIRLFSIILKAMATAMTLEVWTQFMVKCQALVKLCGSSTAFYGRTHTTLPDSELTRLEHENDMHDDDTSARLSSSGPNWHVLYYRRKVRSNFSRVSISYLTLHVTFRESFLQSSKSSPFSHAPRWLECRGARIIRYATIVLEAFSLCYSVYSDWLDGIRRRCRDICIHFHEGKAPFSENILATAHCCIRLWFLRFRHRRSIH